MTIQQLQYVVALDTHRHFVKASESCYVAQPTLTLQVKKLEEQMSISLFDRSSQPLKPTPLGEIFILKARQILHEIDELKEIVNNDKDQMEGEFRVGIIPTLGPSLLPLFIDDFVKKFPNTKLHIDELQSDKIIEKIKYKLLDLAIMVTPLEEPAIREIPVFYEPFMVYSNKGGELLNFESVSTEQLKPEGLWVLKQGHCFRNQTLNICDFESVEGNRNIVMEGGSIETLKRMLQKVSGYTLIPELSFDQRHDNDYVVQFEEPKPVREVSIVTHKNFTKERLVDELRKSIIANTPEHLKKNTRFVTVKWR